jgi:hypothetical protein
MYARLPRSPHETLVLIGLVSAWAGGCHDTSTASAGSVGLRVGPASVELGDSRYRVRPPLSALGTAVLEPDDRAPLRTKVSDHLRGQAVLDVRVAGETDGYLVCNVLGSVYDGGARAVRMEVDRRPLELRLDVPDELIHHVVRVGPDAYGYSSTAGDMLRGLAQEDLGAELAQIRGTVAAGSRHVLIVPETGTRWDATLAAIGASLGAGFEVAHLCRDDRGEWWGDDSGGLTRSTR